MKAAVCALLLAIGALSMLVALDQADAAKQRERIQKLEADVRTYAGKYLDLQEGIEDEIQQLRSAAELASYELSECRKEKQ